MAVTLNGLGSGTNGTTTKKKTGAIDPWTQAGLPAGVTKDAPVGGADYRDATYWNQIAKLQAGSAYTTGSYNAANDYSGEQFQHAMHDDSQNLQMALSQGKASLSQSLAFDKESLASALKQLAFNQEGDTLSNTRSLHSRGLLHSGEFDRSMGALAEGYGLQREGLNDTSRHQQESLTLANSQAAQRAQAASSQFRTGAQSDYDYQKLQRANEYALSTSQGGPGGTSVEDERLAAIQRGIDRPVASATSAGGGAASPAAGPKPGYQFIQTSGTRSGQSYNLRPGPDGQLWRYYANGDKVPR